MKRMEKMSREVNKRITALGKTIHALADKENIGKRELYRLAINKCCMPNCKFGLDLEVHHIVPISKGGTDTFDNFIVLCQKCHRKNRLHAYWGDKRIALLAYKIYMESDIIGKDSADYSDDEFWKVLKNFFYHANYPVKSLKEESNNYEENEENYAERVKLERMGEF